LELQPGIKRFFILCKSYECFSREPGVFAVQPGIFAVQSGVFAV
jgi:hypothetical protein